MHLVFFFNFTLKSNWHTLENSLISYYYFLCISLTKNSLFYFTIGYNYTYFYITYYYTISTILVLMNTAVKSLSSLASLTVRQKKI